MAINFRIKPIDPHYPYLIVHLMATVYQHVEICFRETEKECSPYFLEVVCPKPNRPDGTLTDIARGILLKEVKKRVAKEAFPMCVVLTSEHALFVGLDGSVEESGEPPYTNMLGADLEVYDHGRMPTRESVDGRLSEEQDDFLEVNPKTYCAKVGEEGGKFIVRPILSFSDLWELANCPYWLLCLYRWMRKIDPYELGNYSSYCWEQVGIGNNYDSVEAQATWRLLGVEPWNAIWTETMCLEVLEGREPKFSTHLDWSKETSSQLRHCISNPFASGKTLPLPLSLDDVLWHYFHGKLVLKDDGKIVFQMHAEMALGAEQ